MRRGWLATVTGSGILFILIAAFGITTAREAKRIYAELSSNDQDIQLLEVQLTGLRADIFLSGIYVRDQLLDSKSAIADDQRDKLLAAHKDMQDRLRRIEVLVTPDQAPQIAELRAEMDRYWDFISPIADDPAAATATEWAAVREQLLQRRDSSLAIAQEVGRLNRTTYQDRHDRIEAAEASFLRYIRTMIGVALGLGAIVLAGSSYIVRVLHERAEAHRLRVEGAESEMRRLSAELLHAQEQERCALSRELHDEVGQTITALGIELGNIERSRTGPPSQFLHHVDEAKKLTQDTLKTVRDLAMGLRPAVLDDSGLAPAVRYLAREFSRRSGIPATVDIDGSVDHLSDAHRTCVYRIVQEALTNCARHAHAKNVHIRVAGNQDSLSLRIEDDGVGIREFSSAGLGLIGIGERTRELHGSMQIAPGAAKGTVLKIDLPLADHVAG